MSTLAAACLELIGLVGGHRLQAVEEALHQRRVAVVGDERRQHLHVAPGRAVDRALVRAVDVGLHRAAPPRLAARRQLEVDAAFGSAADAAAAARRLRPGLANQGIDVLEEVGMILDELADADVHPLFVAFSDEDDVDRQLAGDRLDRHQRLPLRMLRPLAVDRAAADQDFLVRRLLDDARFEGRGDPGVGLRHRHRVVLPVNRDRARRAFVAAGVDDRVARRAPLGDADVVDARFLAAKLVEEALHHLGAFRDAFAAVRDARLANPLLQVHDVIVDVLVDIGEDLLELLGLDLRQIRLNLRVAIRPDAELRRGRRGRRRCRCGRGRLARASGCRHQHDESHEPPAHTFSFVEVDSVRRVRLQADRESGASRTLRGFRLPRHRQS